MIEDHFLIDKWALTKVQNHYEPVNSNNFSHFHSGTSETSPGLCHRSMLHKHQLFEHILLSLVFHHVLFRSISFLLVISSNGIILKKNFSKPILRLSIRLYAIEPAFEAIRGHRSAHSFATGPVIAEPFISPLLFTMTPALSSK